MIFFWLANLLIIFFAFVMIIGFFLTTYFGLQFVYFVIHDIDQSICSPVLFIAFIIALKLSYCIAMCVYTFMYFKHIILRACDV